MKKLLAFAIFGLCINAFTCTAEAAECGDVSIAEMNWASAGVAAQVDKIILQNGYDCNVTLVTGDTQPTFASMDEKGQPDVAPELWLNDVRAPLEKAVNEGRLVIAAPLLTEGGVEGWWIPKFLADAHPEVKTVQDVLLHPELFPAPEDPTKGAVYSCPSGWSCQTTTANLFKAVNAEKYGFTLVDPGSAAGLDGSIANAFEKKIGWLGYYWAPTAILGKYDMVRLSFGVPHDKKEWEVCTSQQNCSNPEVNSYPAQDVYTVVTKAFAEKAGVAMDYLKIRKWDNGTVARVLAWMVENQGTNEDGAKYFLQTYPNIWTEWVSPDVARKINAAL